MAEVVFPDSIQAFQKSEMIDNEAEHPGLGCTVPYNAPGVKATIYVYDLNFEVIPDGPESECVLQHFRNEVAQLTQMVEHGLYASASVNQVYVTGGPERGREFLCADISIRQNGQELDSYLYLTGYDGKFVKVRVTSPSSEQSEMQARKFADEVSALLQSSK
mgnify:CR=1 FL=1|tara:strand:- start:836 stop:1321 length:486 start_codon:yes stop_codon:yes gene_type:complete